VPEDASPIGQPLQSLLPAQIWQVHGQRFTAAARGLHQEYDDIRPGGSGSQHHRRIQLMPGAADDQGRHEVLMQLSDIGREYARGEVIERQREQLQTLHEQLRSSRQDAGELDRLRTLLDWRTAMLSEHNEMLQLLSHEIRQPLNNASAAMQATLKAIEDLHLADAAPAAKALLRAEHVLQQVIGTLDNTLAAGTILAAGGKAGASSETDLPTLIKLVLHDIAADLRPRIDAMADHGTHRTTASGADAADASQSAQQRPGLCARRYPGAAARLRVRRAAGADSGSHGPGPRHCRRNCSASVRKRLARQPQP
jgi:signal transduction histidine kinase